MATIFRTVFSNIFGTKGSALYIPLRSPYDREALDRNAWDREDKPWTFVRCFERFKHLWPVAIALLPLVLFWAQVWPLNGSSLDCRARIALAGIPPRPPGSPVSNDVASNNATWARSVTPSQLMATLENHSSPEATYGSKIIHQSWKDNDLPERFQLWSHEWQRMHPHADGWSYVCAITRFTSSPC
jgi:hypothetical protein